MSHPFDGIYEKLNRAEENILNLNGEIDTFFEKGKYPVLPNPDNQEWKTAVDYHRSRVIPLRFSVLSGEIVHHLRSCLDHIVWHFSTPDYRRDHETAIEFPIFSKDPVLDKEELRRYNRKVKGVSKPKVLSLIENMQPYKARTGAKNHIIGIIHDMDRFDKHRELTIVSSCASVQFPPGTNPTAIKALIAYRDGKPLSVNDTLTAMGTLKKDAKVVPAIAFAKFGEWESQFVIPSLAQCLAITRDVVKLFASEC